MVSAEPRREYHRKHSEITNKQNQTQESGSYHRITGRSLILRRFFERHDRCCYTVRIFVCAFSISLDLYVNSHKTIPDLIEMSCQEKKILVAYSLEMDLMLCLTLGRHRSRTSFLNVTLIPVVISYLLDHVFVHYLRRQRINGHQCRLVSADDIKQSNALDVSRNDTQP